MGLIDGVKEIVVGGDEERTYRYHCRACETRFESPKQGTSQVSCPECGISDNRKISRL